jgi:hypothetical protein
MSLNKGNILRVITSDDLVIHVKKKKGPTTRWHVDKESWIMSAGRKASSCDHISKMLKPSPRSLLKAKKRVTKVTNHTLRDRIPKWWTHVNILTQLTIKKAFFTSSWEIDHSRIEVIARRVWIVVIWTTGAKSLIIIMTLLLLKTTINKTSLIALKRTIIASLNLIDPLTSDWTNTWGTWHNIPCVSLLKSSNLHNHRVLPFRMKNNITIRSWLRKSGGCESRRRVTVK